MTNYKVLSTFNMIHIKYINIANRLSSLIKTLVVRGHHLTLTITLV